MATAVAVKGTSVMDKKTVSISSKRQITIPQKFFAALGFSTEAECVMRNNELVIRPIRESSGGDFAEQILEDLVKEGLSGENLLIEFRKRQLKVRPAVEAMIAEAENVAAGNGEYFTYDDIFGSEED